MKNVLAIHVVCDSRGNTPTSLQKPDLRKPSAMLSELFLCPFISVLLFSEVQASLIDCHIVWPNLKRKWFSICADIVFDLPK